MGKVMKIDWNRYLEVMGAFLTELLTFGSIMLVISLLIGVLVFLIWKVTDKYYKIEDLRKNQLNHLHEQIRKLK